MTTRGFPPPYLARATAGAVMASCVLGCGDASVAGSPVEPVVPEMADAAAVAAPAAPGTTIVPTDSLLCVEAEPDGQVLQTTCTNGDAQRFQLVPTASADASDAGPPTYVILTSLGGCLDYGTYPGTGVAVTASTCLAGSSRQSFTVTAHGDGSYTLAAAGANACFGPEDASSTDRASMITYTCVANAPAQRAYLAELGMRPGE